MSWAEKKMKRIPETYSSVFVPPLPEDTNDKILLVQVREIKSNPIPFMPNFPENNWVFGSVVIEPYKALYINVEASKSTGLYFLQTDEVPSPEWKRCQFCLLEGYDPAEE